MNLICITESELAQWVSRRYFDTLVTRVLIEQKEVTQDVFSTAPYLKIDDARGRVIINLKENWKNQSQRVNLYSNIEVFSIPLDAISEIAPTMDQYAKKLDAYKLPIAKWSIEKIWDKWLLNQSVLEIYRATVLEVKKIGCVDKESIQNEELIKTVIKKSLRPNAHIDDISILRGWHKVFELRDGWLQRFRVDGYLDSTRMFDVSIESISNDVFNRPININNKTSEKERGWEFQDIAPETLEQISKYDKENVQLQNFPPPPLFCIAAYLRLYDEIHNGNKDWRIVFNLLRFAKYSVNSFHADVVTIALIASLNTKEIYDLGLRDLYML